MEKAKAMHTIAVEMTTGMLVLATLAIFALACLAMSDDKKLMKYRSSLDMVALLGTSLGSVMFALAIISGYQQWPLEAFMNGTIARNKIFSSYMALAFWLSVLGVRLSAGKGLWERKGLAAFSALLALGGFLYTIFTASIGGTIAKKPSGFEDIARMVVETRETFTLPAGVSIALIVVGVAAPVAAYFLGLKKSGA